MHWSITAACAVVAMPSFQNPLGACMSEAAKRRLLKIVQRHDIALIEDDVFGDLGSAAERPPAVKAWDRDGRVIIADRAARAWRRAFAWAGCWAAPPAPAGIPEDRQLAGRAAAGTAGVGRLQSGRLPAHLRRLRTQLAQAAASARACAQRHFPQGTRVLGPEGGWWLWLELPEPADTLALLRVAVSRHRLHARRPVLGRGQARSLPAPERRAALVRRDGGRAGAAGPGRAAGGDPKPGRPACRA